jgi:glycosyltransferase involved in cell wall biosynthesis
MIFKQYTSSDIQIFIITRNRPEMLKQALNSVLNQHASGSPIYVLDNSTNDKTQKVTRDYPIERYIKTDPLLPFANFLMAQSLMTKPYSMILHDDDLIHPGYVALALKILNSVENITYIGCKNTIFFNNDIPNAYANPKALKEDFYLLDNKNDFTLSFWSAPNSNWSSAIIRSDLYKQENLETHNKLYGKHDDLALLSSIMNTGKAAIIKDRNALFYRVHGGADSRNIKTALTEQQIMNYARLFYDCSLGNKYLRRIYFVSVLDNIKNDFFPNVAGNRSSLNSFLAHLKDEGLLSSDLLLYNRRREDILIRFRFLFRQWIYKRNYYKRFLQKLS